MQSDAFKQPFLQGLEGWRRFPVLQGAQHFQKAARSDAIPIWHPIDASFPCENLVDGCRPVARSGLRSEQGPQYHTIPFPHTEDWRAAAIIVELVNYDLSLTV